MRVVIDIVGVFCQSSDEIRERFWCSFDEDELIRVDVARNAMVAVFEVLNVGLPLVHEEVCLVALLANAGEVGGLSLVDGLSLACKTVVAGQDSSQTGAIEGQNHALEMRFVIFICSNAVEGRSNDLDVLV